MSMRSGPCARRVIVRVQVVEYITAGMFACAYGRWDPLRKYHPSGGRAVPDRVELEAPGEVVGPECDRHEVARVAVRGLDA